MNPNSGRIAYLDALRGIAILSVVFFHAYYRWNEIEPFEQTSVISSSVRYGWLGVQLFFAISGYVIYMSLIRSDNFFHFATNRWLRLFPGMLLATVIIFFSSFYIAYRPIGEPNFVDIFPGITFVDPIIINSLFGVDSKSLDGVFWSLYVEVKFYALAAFLFFVVRDKYLTLMSALYIFYFIIFLIKKYTLFNSGFPALEYLYLGFRGMGIHHYGWFLLGIYSYLFVENKRTFYIMIALIFSVMGVFLLYQEGETPNFIFLFLCFIFILIFLIPLRYERAQIFLSNRILIFFGFISYPLYLLHQNIVSGLAIHFSMIFPGLPPVLYPLPFILTVSLAAFLVAKTEPHMKSAIKKRLPDQLLGKRIK